MAGKAVLSGTHFMNGDEACCEGALAAGCRFFAGYPITPATEVAERMSQRLPSVGGIFIQMEDEIASMAAILGASWGGIKSMTSTSGPGYSLMTENLGLGICTETPCVVCNVQRAGPSTGLPTLVGQGDMMQARWGSHGHYEIIAVSPSSPQEMFDLTVKAFNLSEEFRVPVTILADEVVGHMNERVVIPDPHQIHVVDRPKPTMPPEEYLPYQPGPNGVPPMATFGEGYFMHVTGLTHDARGYPVMDANAQAVMTTQLVDKIRGNLDRILDYTSVCVEDAEVVVVAYGISARSARGAVLAAREAGLKVGLVKLNVVWPFPEDYIRELSHRVKALIMPEINLGQMVLELERLAQGRCAVTLVPHPGGGIINPDRIVDAVRTALEEAS